MDKKVLRNKIIIIFIIGILLWGIEIFITPYDLIEQISNPILRIVVSCLTRILYASGIWDVILILKDIAKFLFSAWSYKIWDNIKSSVRYKISYVATDWEGIEDVINKVYNIYPNYTYKNIESFLENLSQQFYKDESKKEDIAFFFISNRKTERIKSFLTNHTALYADCERIANNAKVNFLNINFSKEMICKGNADFQHFVSGVRFLCISLDKFDEHVYDTLKKFITCFNEVVKDKQSINNYQILRILQIFWKIEKKMKDDYIRCHDDMIAKQLKKLEKDLNSEWVKSNINNICRNVKISLSLKNISKEELMLYISKANVLLSYWEKITFFSKISLVLALKKENKEFNAEYYKDDLTSKAIMLLLGAEVLSVDFNPKEDLSGRMASLIISVAGLVIG